VSRAGVAAALLALAALAHAHPFFENERGVQVIAHRGGAALRPENTLAAFEHAAVLGADILEMDLRVTADGAIVVLHDADVDRTTDGSGAVAKLSLAQLRALDAGYRWSIDGGASFPYRGHGVRIPTLEEVFKRLPSSRMNIEMKEFTPDGAGALCALIRREDMQAKVLIASAPDEGMNAFRKACPEVATSMTASEARAFILFGRLTVASVQALQIPDRAAGRVLPSRDLIGDSRRRNLKVYVWTINDEQRMRELIELGVDGIITDRPDRLLELKRRSP
jgi:glycerophosphoryl diester phosphodiesterase